MDRVHRALEFFGIPYFECSRCRLWKTEEHFKKNRANALGIHYWCRTCMGVKARRKRRRLPAGGIFEAIRRIVEGPQE